MYIIGVDIGGTNTDVALIERVTHKLVASVKEPTTRIIDEGFDRALRRLLAQTQCDVRAIQHVFVGTTHATNALLRREDLYRVGLIRIAGHYPITLPPCFGWPDDVRSVLLAGAITIDGGYECDGSPLTLFNSAQAKEALQQLVAGGAESIALVGVFSPLYPEHELEVERLAALALGPHIPVSLSYQIGGVGIIERENSTLLNAALIKPLTKGFQRLQEILVQLGIHAPLGIAQNNGTIISLSRALKYPILTLAAGPTNSFIGGAKLAGVQDAVIVDIGGTSTDVGLMTSGFPRRSLQGSCIGGISLNFPMPDVLSIALGGGSYVALDTGQIGPLSAGCELLREARCFGGNRLTLTDVAVAHHPLCIPGAQPVDCPQALTLLREAARRIDHLVDTISGGDLSLPVIVVGGGATLFQGLFDPARYHIPPHAAVANALGAAVAEVSGTIDLIISLKEREKTLSEIIEQSIALAITRGAHPQNVRLIDLQVIPYHYVPGQLARVIATAAGPLRELTAADAPTSL